MKRSILLGTSLAVLAAAGCGGNGKNPEPTDNQIPESYSLPIYEATDSSGSKLYLQFKKSGTALTGQFAFFMSDGEGGLEPDILSGPVAGTVQADGTVQATLTNPYDETVPPIEVEGEMTAEGMRLHDVETPEEVVEFTKSEEGLTVTRAPHPSIAVNFTTPTAGYINTDPGKYAFPPFTFVLEYANVYMLDGFVGLEGSVLETRYPNGWSSLDLYKFSRPFLLTQEARLWVQTGKSGDISPDSTYRTQAGKWVQAVGKIQFVSGS